MIDDVSGSAQKYFGDLTLKKSRSPEVKRSIKLIMAISTIKANKKDLRFSLARASIFQVQVKRSEAGVKIRVELFNY